MHVHVLKEREGEIGRSMGKARLLVAGLSGATIEVQSDGCQSGYQSATFCRNTSFGHIPDVETDEHPPSVQPVLGWYSRD